MNVTQEQLRLMLVSVISPILAFLTPTSGFITALVFMFGFNIICGLRADGVNLSVNGVRRFSMLKFISAVQELILYILVIAVIFSSVVKMGIMMKLFYRQRQLHTFSCTYTYRTVLRIFA